MDEIKFRYSVIRENGHYFEEIFTLDQIEKGEIQIWIKVNFINPSDIKRDIFLNKYDVNNQELYTSDIVEWDQGKGFIFYDSDYTEFKHTYIEKIDPDCERPPKKYWKRIKKIGNRWKNPELLKDDK